VDMHSRVKEVQTQDYGVRIAIDRAGFPYKSRLRYLYFMFVPGRLLGYITAPIQLLRLKTTKRVITVVN